jgi:hypothetical protein
LLSAKLGITQQRFFLNTFKKNLKTFAECRVSEHSAKNFHKKKKMKTLCRVLTNTGYSAVTAPFLCRVLSERSAKPLPSARQMALGKGGFADDFFSKCSLPSVTLDEAFAKCIRGFAGKVLVSGSEWSGVRRTAQHTYTSSRHVSVMEGISCRD